MRTPESPAPWSAGAHPPARVRRLAHPLLWPALALALLAFAWRSQGFWDALSPLSHKKDLYALGGRHKVDPLLLAAIIRTESRYNPFAESQRGALGLMQLLPSTAEEAARELKLNYLDSGDLYAKEINLQLGAYHFAKQLKAFDGDLVLALAAYNAGAAKVRAWGLEAWGAEQGALIDAIPVPETRHYVRRVLGHYRFYKGIQSVKRFLNADPLL